MKIQASWSVLYLLPSSHDAYSYAPCDSHLAQHLIPFHRPSLPQIWEFWVAYGVERMLLCHGWGCHLIHTAFHIHTRYKERVWTIGMLSQSAYMCTLITFLRPSWPQIWGFWVAYWVEMKLLFHGWGCHPIQTAFRIHIRYIQSVWAFVMMSQGYMCAPLYHSTSQVCPRFGNSGVLMEWKWCHYVWLRMISTSDRFIHTYTIYIQSVWAIGMLSQGYICAPFYHSTGQVGPRFGTCGSLMEWKWCHYVMFEAAILFKLLHASTFGTYKLFEHIDLLSIDMR